MTANRLTCEDEAYRFDDEPREDENGVSLDQEPLACPAPARKKANAADSVPWIKFYADRYMADVTDFTVTETAAYFRLLMNQMVYGDLPRDERKLRRIARLTEKEWKKSRDALSDKFGEDWRHERLAQDREEAVRSVRQRVEAGRKGGLKRVANLGAVN